LDLSQLRRDPASPQISKQKAIGDSMTPDDITAGEHWACMYRTTRMLGEDNRPAVNLRIGETARGPATWDSLGVIVVRDSENKRLEVVDVYDRTRHVVSYDDVWDIDRAEIVDDEV
jgi:hypothetical protein